MLLEDGTQLLLIHFLYRSPQGLTKAAGRALVTPIETWKIACVPDLMEMSTTATRQCPWQRTDEVRAVTCPLCKDTEVYKEAYDQLNAALNALRRK